MPTYTVRSKSNGEEVGNILLSISEIDEWENNNPTLELAIGAPLIHTGRGMKKPDQGFRDHLKSIKKANKNSTVNDF